MSYLETLDLFSDTVLFRGQAQQGNLIPGIARKNPGKDTTTLERKMLNQFRLQGASLLPNSEMSDLELLVLAQHFEMNTRLLDWTTNPLAAMWFACSSRSPGDVYVYALDADNFQLKDIYKDDPFTHGSTLVFQPRLDNPRILAQNGWFTLHHYSSAEKSKKFVPIEHQKQMKDKLTQIVIAADNRSFILQSLSRMGIHHRSLFPDLTGLTRHLNGVY